MNDDSSCAQISESFVEKTQGVWAQSSESEVSGEEDDVFPGAKPHEERTQSGDSESEEEEVKVDDDSDIDDFIVDDDGDGDAAASLPIAFSMRSHQDLVHHFKVVCQYFVHLAVTADRSRKRQADKLMKGVFFFYTRTANSDRSSCR